MHQVGKIAMFNFDLTYNLFQSYVSVLVNIVRGTNLYYEPGCSQYTKVD